jgi:probable rRNA maturation factor
MISIEVISDNKLWNKRIKNRNIFFNKLVSFFPKKYKFRSKKVSFSVMLSDDKTIKKLNKKFRNKKKPTDVLSFPSEKNFDIKKNSYLGDIIISYEFMNKPKFITNLEFKKKVIKIFIHGFLHLLGYDHIKLRDFKKMFKEEEKIYKFINTKIIKIV